jgi:hypothetical protein
MAAEPSPTTVVGVIFYVLPWMGLTPRADRDRAPQFVYNVNDVAKFASGKDKAGRVDGHGRRRKVERPPSPSERRKAGKTSYAHERSRLTSALPIIRGIAQRSANRR